MYEIDLEKFSGLSPEEQLHVTELLDKLSGLATENPLRHWYPHEKQKDFLKSRSRFKWMLGGNQSGKTTVCCVDDLIQAVDLDALPSHLKPYKWHDPPFKWRVVGPDFDIVEMVVMEKLKELVPPYQLIGNSWDNGYDAKHRVLRFKNGSSCQFKTYQQEAWTHGGATLDRVRFDEEPPRDIFNENKIRVMARSGDLLVAMTPVQGLTWMYEEFWEPYQVGRLQNSFVQTVDMDDNPAIDEQQQEETLRGYSREEREARKTGHFVHFHGRVYGEFTTQSVIPEDDVPVGLPIYVGIDPGIRHMAAVVFMYHTPDDTLVIFEELALKDMNVAEVATAIKETEIVYGIKPTWYVIDPSARNKQHVTGRNLQLEYADYGVLTFPGQNDVATGISRVKVRLEHKKLLVMANCTETIKEFRQYRWSKPARQTPNDPKETPIKKDDHLLDAIRYAVMARPYRPEVKKEDQMVDPLTLAAWTEMKGKPQKDEPAWVY
jgi:phage terminase large subunit-like protein